MLLSITQPHIDAGKPNVGHKCPIALAFADLYPGSAVSVGRIFASIVSPYVGRLRYELSGPACDFVADFDEAGSAAVAPATFNLRRMRIT